MKISSEMFFRGVIFTGRPSEAVRKQELAAMHEATQFAARKVKEKTPQGVMGSQGGLMDTIIPEVRQSRSRVNGLVSTPSPYGLVVEKGRRPGGPRPPEGVLLRWIELKMHVTPARAKEIEPVLRWKIAKKGTEGAKMFERTLDEDWPDIQGIFDRYGVSIARGLSS